MLIIGKKGREIAGTEIKEAIEELNEGYALEWAGAYYYSLAANLVAGIQAPIYIKLFKEHAEEGIVHANKLADRVVQLGGEPIRDLAELEKKADMKVILPKDLTDIKGFLRALIEIERKAIEFYQRLAQRTHNKDLVTHELAEDLLENEVHDEEELENLIGGE